MNIETDKLLLRELEESDSEKMFFLSSDPEITRHMDYIVFKTESEAKKWVEEKIHHNNQIPRSSYNFAIELKGNHKFVGWIGIGKSSDSTKGDLDFGYAVLKKHWGKGIATEALKAIIDLAWKETKANKIFGECRIRNTASMKVMERAGMKLETDFEEDGKKSVRYVVIRTDLF